MGKVNASMNKPVYSGFLILDLNKIEILSGFNWNRTHNHLVCKPTFNHLAKMA